ncbi:lipopolysaccharide assembly protein LapB [Dysgonomonas sp. 520]|uniref:tetratricopeptide repeat protein n=1 Tax=Dysgonomonas sp. 520 TaxID=2302931 RepID=UPI0013D31929|nr:tetratricopeptide repeat protein [Dysgonomonas sp. 520]NDW11100.1 hypothetical protein [Dysgonomonas sp. 520]
MKRKFFLGTFLSILISTVSFAQNDLGKEYFYVKEYDAAKQIFEQQTTAEAYYYLGEIALANGDQATAKSNFEKGLAANPEFVLNNVGLGKLILKSDPKEAENVFSAAIKKNKKDVEVLVTIANAYFENGMKDKADKMLADARKAKKDSPYPYIAAGDMLFAEKDINKAASQYGQAIHFAPKSIIAYIRSAQLYDSTVAGRATAIDDLNRGIEARPDFLPTYKYLGNLYYLSGNYAKTIETYNKYSELGGEPTTSEIANLSGAYYFTKQYDEAKKLLTQGLSKYPNDFFMNRVLMYVYTDTQDYESAVSTGDKFFSVDVPKNANYLFYDYMKYGTSLGKLKRGTEAVAQFHKALALSEKDGEVNHDLYKELAQASSNAGEAGEGALFYKKYIELTNSNDVRDYFDMGRYYYASGVAVMAGLRDTTKVTPPAVVEKGMQDLKEADVTFAKVIELEPTNIFGYLYRARANSAMDPTSENGLAKPYYSQLEEMISKNNAESGEFNNRAELAEAYYYLSVYSYQQYDKAKTPENKALVKLYSEKLLAVDPTNPTAIQLVEYFK